MKHNNRRSSLLAILLLFLWCVLPVRTVLAATNNYASFSNKDQQINVLQANLKVNPKARLRDNPKDNLKINLKDNRISNLKLQSDSTLQNSSQTQADKASDKKHAADASDGKTFSNWTEVAEEMQSLMLKAVDLFKQGDKQAAYNSVNEAYFGHYEVTGFERITMEYISGKHGREVEGQIYKIRRMTKEDVSVEDLQSEVDKVNEMLIRDASTLDGKAQATDGGVDIAAGQARDSWGTFIYSLVLLLREGLEAILVIVAILAYLAKTGKKGEMRGVYFGALAGIVFSIIMAVALNMLTAGLGLTETGKGREIFEGVAMLLAVVVLYWVSNWMINKSEVESWQNYIEGMVDTSLTAGSRWALIFSAFIAVAREGAELILFYQALLNNQTTDKKFMWFGIVVGAITLAVIYVLIRFFSVRLPLKPFFLATSTLMFVLCFSFLGKGISEFQEADVIGRTYIFGQDYDAFSFEWLGIYDRYETLVPQILLLLLTVAIFIRYKRRSRSSASTQ